MEECFKFWKGKRVLLTGHTGFKGTWMTIMLNTLGAEVCGYSLPLSPYSFYTNVQARVSEHCEGDIADREKLEKAITGFKPEIIIHMASHSSLDGSDKIPDFILRTNIMGVVNLLDISRSVECVRSVLIVTSDKCYRNLESEIPYREEAELGGEDPYSVSKVCQELITRCYQKTFFEQSIAERNNICVATARASNVIGVGDYNISRLIPYVLDNFVNNTEALIRNPKAVRPWQYVLDVIWGYLLLAKVLYEESAVGNKYNGAYNFGPDRNGFWEVGALVEAFARQFHGSKYSFGEVSRSVRNETTILKLDSTKAQTTLNWHSIYSVEEMVREISSIMTAEKEGKQLKELCEDAVYAYLEKVKIDE